MPPDGKIQLRNLYTPKDLSEALDNFKMGDSLVGGYFCSRLPHKVYGLSYDSNGVASQQDKVNIYCRSYNKSLYTFNSKDVRHGKALLTEKTIMRKK
jgi:hypothetical protein